MFKLQSLKPKDKPASSKHLALHKQASIVYSRRQMHASADPGFAAPHIWKVHFPLHEPKNCPPPSSCHRLPPGFKIWGTGKGLMSTKGLVYFGVRTLPYIFRGGGKNSFGSCPTIWRNGTSSFTFSIMLVQKILKIKI